MHLADGFFDAYQRTYVLTDFTEDRKFIFLSVSKNLPAKIFKEARAGNIPYIVKDMLDTLELYVPTLPEQEKIGDFFAEFDELILAQSKVRKKAYLGKMFL